MFEILIITRKEAKRAGLKKYYSGVPCKNGHVSSRFTSNTGCVQCLKNKQIEKRHPRERLTPEEVRKRGREASLRSYHKYKHLGKAAERQKKFYKENREYVNARANRWKNSEKGKAYRKRWNEENYDKVLGYSHKRTRRIREATPPWITETQRKEMIDVYMECRRISRETGVLHHVDHIIPLKGPDVRGLHVPWNLQILPAKVNQSKHARKYPNE